MKKQVVILLMVFMTMLSMVACGGSRGTTAENTSSAETEETYAEFSWPTSDIAKLLPVPKSDIGKISWEASYGFVIYVAETSKEDFKDYVDACKDAGFTVDYRAGDDFYYADNKDNYHLTLNYEDGDVMFIRIDEPDEEETSESATSESTTSESATSESTETQESSDSTITNESGIRPEFKEAMDSYEEFFDEYCEFMKKYSEADDPTSMISDYTDYMTKYTDTMSKMSELGDSDLSTEELAYYTEVNARITQKLLEVAQ